MIAPCVFVLSPRHRPNSLLFIRQLHRTHGTTEHPCFFFHIFGIFCESSSLAVAPLQVLYSYIVRFFTWYSSFCGARGELRDRRRPPSNFPHHHGSIFPSWNTARRRQAYGGLSYFLVFFTAQLLCSYSYISVLVICGRGEAVEQPTAATAALITNREVRFLFVVWAVGDPPIYTCTREVYTQKHWTTDGRRTAGILRVGGGCLFDFRAFFIQFYHRAGWKSQRFKFWFEAWSRSSALHANMWTYVDDGCTYVVVVDHRRQSYWSFGERCYVLSTRCNV